MNSAYAHAAGRGHIASTANSRQKFAPTSGQATLFPTPEVTPGSFDDTGLVRFTLIQSIKKSGKSRAEIAETMSFLLGRQVTEAMLNAFTAESRGDRRFPAEYDRAFCAATGDNTLMVCRIELAGLHVIDDNGMKLLELGREYLRGKRATEAMAEHERSLQGVEIG